MQTGRGRLRGGRNPLPVLALLLWAAACGDGATEPPGPQSPDSPRPTTVTVSPATFRLTALRQTVQLTARVLDQNGQAIAGATVTWASSAAAVASVSGSGLVTAAGNGSATITASAGSASGSAEITVAILADSPDRRALEVLYETTLGASWTNATNWLGSAPVGEWHGVEVDAAGRVTGLALSSNNLTGWIPPEVGDLDRLRYLHIDHNALTGPLPPELAAANELTSLRISDNTLSGPLPRSLLALSLEEFRYADTELCVPPYDTFRSWLDGIAAHGGTGVECAPLTDREILVRLYEATRGPHWKNNTNWLTEAPLNQWYGVATDAEGRVTRLDVRFNGLEGFVPPELAGLANLQRLDLRTGDRGLTGTIPPELGQLRQLRRLDLASNGLVGSIPPEIGNALSLEHLSLSNNHLTGPIPRELGQLTRLEGLSLQLNTLSGELPHELGDLARLRYLRLHRNLLLGPIPASMLQLDLRRFHFAENPGICAPGTTRFVSWLGRMEETSGGYCNKGDVAVLERLYESAGGVSWTNSDGWLGAQPLEGWHGVVTDSLGYVQELDLSGNGLAGPLPSALGELAGLTALRIGGNTLTGPLPLSLTQLSLRELHYADTDLCAPVDGGFPRWLTSVSSHEGNGMRCVGRDDRAVLETLYQALGGPRWRRADGWLNASSLGSWRGVRTDGTGRVVELSLRGNNLSGRIPAELGNLSRLRRLQLAGNALDGKIPAAIGNLSELEELNLSFNPLTGEIPPEIGKLSNLRILILSSTEGLGGSIPAELGNLGNLEELRLNNNSLTGSIPPELGNLTNLRWLILYQNALTGDIPASLGDLTQLENLSLHENRLGGTVPPTFGNLRNVTNLDLKGNTLGGRIPRELGRLASVRFLAFRGNLLTGKIPPELGNLASVTTLDFRENRLTGAIPAEIGNLQRLRNLLLQVNRLTGSIPAELGNLAALQTLDLTNNRDMRGALPTSLTSLRWLNELLLANTGLCAPREAVFLDWLAGLDNQQVARCGDVEGSVAYVTQAVQSVDFPVPLVAGNDGLLRVFVRAGETTTQSLPDVRARFFVDGTETHVVDIPAQSATIPTGFEEGDLARSANAVIPGTVMQPGLEMVVEIDPGGTLDSALGVTGRLPETGRTEVDVRATPSFDLTVIPFLAASDPDSSVLEHTRDLDAESDLFRHVRSLLPIGGFTVTLRDPVLTQTIELGSVLQETEAIRVMEGRRGYYLGLARRTTGLRGIADLGRYSSASIPVPDVIAHEIGHNLNLQHAPCGGAGGPDTSFPQRDGSIGSWGFDFLNNALVPPSDPDLMTYCEPRWISGYNFTRMLNHREAKGADAAAFPAPATKSLLLWGGVDGEGELFLDPALVVDAPAVLPSSGGAYRLVGLAADGRELFSFNFEMPTVADGDGQSSFVYTLPVQAAWSGALESITLSGPEGSTTLDRESDRSVTILLDPAAGRVRAILRDSGATAMPDAAAARSAWAAEGLEVLYSRGIPDATAWRR